ncbi:hypothetical protein AVEN_179933-1 [Araneus ventricosus]|uniref:Uncharacterized protein n=1 Tax=Araneus ventricosus TaxID=182803 RepID=A0A4Y2IAY6_ARAVE|nr:hypothetical protein AVEN_179933-1 [Araneus ventricosus]
MSPLTLKKSRASKGSVSKVSLDRRRQERMCSGDALATPHFAQTGKTLLPWMKEQLLRTGMLSGMLMPLISRDASVTPSWWFYPVHFYGYRPVLILVEKDTVDRTVFVSSHTALGHCLR